MTDEKPIGDADASISERLEKYLAAGEETEQQDSGQEAAPEKPVEVEAPESDAQDEADGPQFELPDVAKVLGLEESMLDVDEDGSLKIKTKIDGVEGTAKLQDLVKSYQLQGHIDAKVRQVAEQEKAHVERVNQIEQFAQTKLQELEMTAHLADQILMQESSQVDWDRLVMEDPIGYQTKRHEFERKQAQANHLKQSVAQKRGEIQQAMAWRQAQELQQEAQRLSTLVPEWSDAKVRESEGAEMRSWLQTRGVSERAINGLTDAGMVAALRAGMLAEKNAPKVAAAEKKVRLAPKLVRPGQGTDAKQRANESVRGLKENIRKSGGKQGIEEYLIATGKV